MRKHSRTVIGRSGGQAVRLAGIWLVARGEGHHSRAMMPYERFRAWQKCHELVLAVHLATRTWPREEQYGLIAQAKRAAFSAAANLVGGAARRGSKEFRRFLDIGMGSLAELSYILRLVRDLELAPSGALDELEGLRESASKLTWRLYESAKKRGLPNGISSRRQASAD